jgi:trk system potassium uptake protein TrkA
MKSILVIGLGNFGKNLAYKLQELGNDVMVIDSNEKKIQAVANDFTEAFTGDCTNEAVISSLGVNNFDICYVTTGGSFQASLEITSLLKEHGAKYIVSKATQEMQAKFLKQIGANEVVYPEKDMALKMAIKHNADSVFDYIQLGEEYALYEVPVPKVWIGKTLKELNIRKEFGVNVISITNDDGKYLLAMPDYKFEENDHILLLGRQDELKSTSKALKKLS